MNRDGFLLAPAREKHLGELARLARSVEQALSSRDMFVADDADFFASVMRGQGSILAAEDRSGRLAGASVIRFPAADAADNLGRESGLEGKDLARVRHLEAVFVREDCRGRGLAARLVRRNMELTAPSGRDLSLATVWPGNLASLRLHFSLGLSIRAFAFKYGGRPRFVLLGGDGLRLGEPGMFSPSLNLDRHRALLARGLAGCAVRTQEDGRDFVVGYAAPLATCA